MEVTDTLGENRNATVQTLFHYCNYYFSFGFAVLCNCKYVVVLVILIGLRCMIRMCRSLDYP